ncbi:MAG TPA: DNA gyrase C-terminal beta-propeller domain-containing protein, partial [Phycisphaerae bacterium]|nr:DNA gyrase C-terminal beta-propeller domain-containing protein [Phycisphaerae bacterium]
IAGDDDEVVLGTREGMAIRFKATDVRAMGRGAGGVRGISLHTGDDVVGMAVIVPGMSLLTICENGFGKRTDIEEYRLQRRGGGGVINIRTTERNGKVVALRAVRDTDEIMLITAGGIMLRTDVSSLREIGRATQGVKVIAPGEGDKVVSVANIVKEDEVPIAEAAAEREETPKPPVDDTPNGEDAKPQE